MFPTNQKMIARDFKFWRKALVMPVIAKTYSRVLFIPITTDESSEPHSKSKECTTRKKRRRGSSSNHNIASVFKCVQHQRAPNQTDLKKDLE